MSRTGVVPQPCHDAHQQWWITDGARGPSVGDGDGLFRAVGDGDAGRGELGVVELVDDHATRAVVIGIEDGGGEAVAAAMAGAERWIDRHLHSR